MTTKYVSAPEEPAATAPRLMVSVEPDNVTSSASEASVFDVPLSTTLFAIYVVCVGTNAVMITLPAEPSPAFV